MDPGARASRFPLGAALTVEELEHHPHDALAALRRREPVSWVPALRAWLVTRRDLVLSALRDADRFTVEDPRFSTARVLGPSMLSLDGDQHARHRAPFAAAFRVGAVRERFTALVRQEARELVAAIRPRGSGDLRAELAAPLAARTMVHALGLERLGARELLDAYRRIVAAVTDLTAGRAPGASALEGERTLRTALADVLARGQGGSLLEAVGGLQEAELFSNAAVVLFGGIETTEGMIANALRDLLGAPEVLAGVRAQPSGLSAVIEESLRLEPAATTVDRYTTAPAPLGEVTIPARELVSLSLAAANRDPAAYAEPDRFLPGRAGPPHLAFAQGAHVCIGTHLARLEAREAIACALAELPDLRSGSPSPPAATGLVFRKPAAVPACWRP